MRLDSNIESKSSNNTLGLTFVCRVGMTSGCLCVTVMPTVYFIDIVSEGQIDALPWIAEGYKVTIIVLLNDFDFMLLSVLQNHLTH